MASDFGIGLRISRYGCRFPEMASDPGIGLQIFRNGFGFQDRAPDFQDEVSDERLETPDRDWRLDPAA
jgi:hypothetical protein